MNPSKAGGGGPHQLQIALKSLKNINWKNKLILDIGCGNGYITNEILKLTQAKKIIGIDIDHERILKAKKLREALNEDKLDFKEADLNDLSQYKDNYFDGIFSNMAIQQIPPKNLPLALKKIRRLLKANGSAIINFNQEKSDLTFEIQKLVQKKKIAKSKKITLQLFKDCAIKLGFSKVKCSNKKDVFYYKSIHELIGNPRDELWRFQGTKLGDKEIKEIWEKIKYIFENRKTDRGYTESWNMVFAQLTK